MGNKIRDTRSIKFLDSFLFGAWNFKLFLSAVNGASCLLSISSCFEDDDPMLVGLAVSPYKYKTQAYSKIAAKTYPMHTTRYWSTAFNPLDVGELFLVPINIFINAKNTVTRIPIRPGTVLGLKINETQVTITSKVDVKYTSNIIWVKARSSKILKPHVANLFPL